MDKPSEEQLRDVGSRCSPSRGASIMPEMEGTAEARSAARRLPIPEKEPPSLSCEEQECRICYNPFDVGRRAPKLLECLHTFCQDCLGRLYLPGSPPSASSSSSSSLPSPVGFGQAYVTCPLCRHRTALPDGCVQSLPVNTKLAPPETLQQQQRRTRRRQQGSAGEPPVAAGDFVGLQQQRLLPSQGASRPAACPHASPPSSRSRSPSQQSTRAAATQSSSSSASVTITSLEACSESDGACGYFRRGCRRKAGCVCLFAALAALLVGFAWMEWLGGFVFLGVALIFVASAMPYVYKLKAVSTSGEASGAAAPWTGTSGSSSGPWEGAGGGCGGERPRGREPGSRTSRS